MLSGTLGGLIFSRRPLMYIQTWTSTSTSQVTRRQRSLFFANYSQEPGTPTESHSPSSSSVPPADA